MAKVLQLQTPEWAVPLMNPSRYKGAWGGRGCIHPDTPIDTPNGPVKVSEFKGGFIYAWHQGQIVNAWATPAIAYDEQQLYKVTLGNGRSISVTDQHRFLTRRGWVQCSDLSTSDEVVFSQRQEQPCLPQSILDTSPVAFPANDRHSIGIDLDCLDHCFLDFHQDGGQLPLEANNGKVFSPSPADALQHIDRALMRLDGQEFLHTDSLLPLLRRLSTQCAGLAKAVQSFEGMESCSADKLSALLWQRFQVVRQFRVKNNPDTQEQGFVSSLQDDGLLKNQAQSHQKATDTPKHEICDIPFDVLSCYHDLPILVKVETICKHDHRVYWDLHVPGYENYLSSGIVNHNSGKSHFFAELMIEAHIMDAKRRSVCVREIQKSLNQSVKRLLETKIEAMNAGAYFEVQDAVIKCRKGDGAIIFQGMQNHTADSIKSLEGYDCAWVEEAQSLSQTSLDLLRPTIRKPGSELWFTWNPNQQFDPVDALLRGATPPKGATVIKVNFTDNPWFPDVLRDEMEYDKRRDPDKYQHVWMGGYLTNGEARVFKNWRVEDFEAPPDATHRLGADWGFAVDPTTLVRCHIIGRTLYIDYEAYMIGCEIVNTPDLFMQVPEAEKWPIVADSARPETISHMRKNGFPKIMTAIKGPKSIEEGIEFLKNYDIVVHPRCTHTIDELTLYSYKKDPITGNVLPKLSDTKNHVIDALRYACEGVRRAAPKKSDNFVPLPCVSKW